MVYVQFTQWFVYELIVRVSTRFHLISMFFELGSHYVVSAASFSSSTIYPLVPYPPECTPATGPVLRLKSISSLSRSFLRQHPGHWLTMSDSESDAPESLSLSQSANFARGREKSIQAYATAEKRKMKEQNRRRDQMLKERAASRKGKGSKAERKVDEEQTRLETRMARAMDEVDGEDEDDEIGEFGGMDGLSNKSSEGADEGRSDSDEHISENDEDGDGDKGESMDEGVVSAGKSSYLPDHLFTVALSKPKPSKEKPSPALLHSKPKLRKRTRAPKNKDIILGYFYLPFSKLYSSTQHYQRTRTIHTLAPLHRTSSSSFTSYTPPSQPGATTPPARINRFLSRRLALIGEGKSKQGWERRPGMHDHQAALPVKNVHLLCSELGCAQTHRRRAGYRFRTRTITFALSSYIRQLESIIKMHHVFVRRHQARQEDSA